MAVVQQAKRSRAADPTLKTQLRWGHKDIEIYLKTKGQQEQYRKTSLKDFMGNENLPEFDTSVKWQHRRDSKFSRKPIFGQNPRQLPSLAAAMAANGAQSRTLTRKHSVGSRGEAAKKQRNDQTISGSDMETQDNEVHNKETHDKERKAQQNTEVDEQL